MRSVFAALIGCVVFFPRLTQADEQLLVASIRQYLVAGKSNAHLYLYGLDGRLIKQLTNTAGCDDLNPTFSDDGKTIYFTRKSTLSKTSSLAGNYQLDIATGALTADKESHFYVSEPVDVLDYSFAVPAGPWGVMEKPDCVSPDGQYRIKIRSLPSPDTNVNPPTQHFLSANGQAEIDITKLPGFIPSDQITGYESLEQLNGTPFVTGPGFAAVFLVHHLNSTDGDQIWGLDLQARKWTKMSQNGGDLYHPPGAAGIFLAADSLYEPLGDTGKTVNCRYLEWWDAHFQMTKLTPPLSVFYSAAIFHGPNETLEIGRSDP